MLQKLDRSQELVTAKGEPAMLKNMRQHLTGTEVFQHNNETLKVEIPTRDTEVTFSTPSCLLSSWLKVLRAISRDWS